MESKLESRRLNLPKGISASYMPGNLHKGHKYVGVMKLGSLTNKFAMYTYDQVLDESYSSDKIEPFIHHWSFEKKNEITHCAYLSIKGAIYLLVGFIGGFELWTEDCVKKIHEHNAEDKGKHESP